MPSFFNRILIPIDFSVNTETAVKKAIGLLDHTDAHIFLLHVLKPQATLKRKILTWEAEKKLQEWKITIEETIPDVKVQVLVRYRSSVEQMIIETARSLAPDLIIIGRQNKKNHWHLFRHFSPDRIARLSNCPVLTVKPGSIHNKTRIIVMPVRHFVPHRKLELAILIAQIYKAQVHLLAVTDNNGKEETDLSQPFLMTYHQLREKLHHPVVHSSIPSHHSAKATLNYAESVMADMILVNPETESGISNFIGSWHMSDLLGKDSRIQVLDVQPYL